MKAADLDILLQEGEGVMLEYKEGLSSSFARELVALANTAGGRILLGVRDDGTVKVIADTNQLRARIQDIAHNCDPPVKVLVQRIEEVTQQFTPSVGTAPSRHQVGTKIQKPTHMYPPSTPQVTGQAGIKLAPSREHDASESTAHVPHKWRTCCHA